MVVIYYSIQLWKESNCDSWCNPLQSAFAKLDVIIIWGSFEGMVFNLLVSYWFVVFVYVFVLCFYYYFCNWSFRKTLWRRLSLVMFFYYCLSPRNTLRVFRIKMRWRLRENIISALFRRGIHVECFYGPCWRLLLSWCLLGTLTLLLGNKLIYYFFYYWQYIQCF